jgi:shikimate dehydrogenase
MKLYGLIGFPLTHSFSKKYFTDKFTAENLTECRYENFPLASIGDFPALMKHYDELKGLNVTIPYKEKILPYLNRVDDNARTIGAVNTIRINRDKGGIMLEGFNTDAYGFRASLEPFLDNSVTGALVLGTGGASKAIAHVLHQMGISVVFVSRHPKADGTISYMDLCGPVLYNASLIINTSPVGMYPDTNLYPDIPYEFITDRHLLYDLIYNPVETEFLRKGREMGARTINGLGMLHLQAEKSWEIWNQEK